MGTLDLAMPQVPLGLLERLLQLSGAPSIQPHQPLQRLAQVGQLHSQMEPVEPVLRVRAQVVLELTEALLAIREEHELLVVP